MDLALEKVIQKALVKNLLTDEQPSLVSQCSIFSTWSTIEGILQDLFDLDYFQGRVESLKKAFPEPFFNHAMAVKANSIRGVLLEANKLGLGGECASLQEAKHCLSLGKIQISSTVSSHKTSRNALEKNHLWFPSKNYKRVERGNRSWLSHEPRQWERGLL